MCGINRAIAKENLMNPESFPPLPECEVKPERPLFDFDQLESADVVRLYAALDAASHHDSDFYPLVDACVNALLELPVHDIEQAREVFFIMVNHDDEWVRATGADLAGVLLRQELSADYNAQQKVIDAWLRLLNEKKGEAASAAGDAMTRAVNSSWLPADIAAYLLECLEYGEEVTPLSDR